MQAANANPMLDLHAPLWERLRGWVKEALYHHGDSLEFRPREQVQPLRRWIALIEHVLRRLILLAATAEKVDVTRQWSPAPKPEPEPPAQDTPPETPDPPPAPRKANAAAVRFRFRLYGITWPRDQRGGQPARAATAGATTALASAASPHYFTVHVRLPPDALLSAGGRPKRPRRTHRNPSRAACRRTRGSVTRPDLTVEQFDAWYAAQTPLDREALNRAWLAQQQRDNDRAARAWRAEQAALARGYDPSTDEPGKVARAARAAAPASEAETPPDLVSTQHYMERLALLEQIASNPQPLIRRAARALARRYEIALRLATAAAPKATSLLGPSPHLYGTLIPVHAAFRVGMEYFAASYTEPDTS